MIRVSKIKSLLALVVLLLTPQLALKAAAQIGTADVVAQGGFALQGGDVLTIAAQIVGCSGNVPFYNGVPVNITPNQTPNTPFTADSTQAVEFILPGNDKILCGGQAYTQYAITWKVNGFPVAPTQTYRIPDGTSTDLNTLTPTGFYPPNLANAAGFSCPFGTSLQGFDQFWTPNCGPTITTNMPSASGPGQLLVSMAAGNNWTLESLVLYQQANDTISSIEAACSAFPCTYYVTGQQVLTVAGAHTLSANVNPVFLSGGRWTVNGVGATLTIPGRVQGTLSTHFLGSAVVKFGVTQQYVPVEWFGAVGDGSTDDTSAIQKALNSITVGQAVLQATSYKTTSPLTISKSSVGIIGTSTNFAFPNTFPSTPPGSVIISNSASADVIDVAGTSTTSNVGFNRFEKFTIARSVIPTGTSAGLSLNFTFAVTIDSVVVEDSVRGFYFHGNGASGIGRIENSTVIWGGNGVTETTGSFYGFYLDSADGVANPSLRIRHTDVTSNLGAGPTTYGLITTGTAINDLMAYGFETAGVSYGEYVNQTGAGTAIASSDIHFWGSINDGCKISCYFITGLLQAGGAGVEIMGGYNTPSATATNPLIDIQNADNVRISGVQLGVAANALASAAINVVSSNDVTITGNQIQGIHNVGILLTNSTAVAITGNDLQGNTSANGLINLVNSSLNAITGNVLTGTGLSMGFDVNSISNTGVYTNTIASTLTGIAMVGSNPLTNGTPISGQLFQLGAAATWSATAGAPSGACVNGSMKSNSLTTTGTFATYQCKATAWVGVGTAY